jgi:hypothetical protein
MPAFAVNVCLVNLSRPLRSAAIDNGPRGGAAVTGADVVDGDVSGAVGEDAVLDPPQATTAAASRMLPVAAAGCLDNSTVLSLR